MWATIGWNVNHGQINQRNSIQFYVVNGGNLICLCWLLSYSKDFSTKGFCPSIMSLFCARYLWGVNDSNKATNNSNLTITATFESGTNWEKMQHFHRITSSGFFFVQLVKQWLRRIQKSNLKKNCFHRNIEFSKCLFWADRTQFVCQSSVQHLYH